MFNLGRIGQQLKTIFTPSSKAEKEQLAKTKGQQSGTTYSTTLDSVSDSVDRIKTAQNNPVVLKKTPLAEPIHLHSQSEKVKKTDNKLLSKAKAFFQKLGLINTPAKKLESLVAQKKYDQAATLVINSEHKEALTLLNALSSDKELFNAIAEKAKHPETKEQTLGLVKYVLETEVQEHAKKYGKDPSSLLRSNTPGSRLLTSFYETLVPKGTQDEIRSLANQQPIDRNFITFKGEIKEKTVSEENQKTVKDNSQKARNVIFEVAKSIPEELQQINQSFRESVKTAYDDETADKQTLAVFFLRFANPPLAEVTSKLVTDNKKSEQENAEIKNKRDNIVLINKMLQNFANGVEFKAKEPHLSFMDDFVTDTKVKKQFLEALLPKPEPK